VVDNPHRQSVGNMAIADGKPVCKTKDLSACSCYVHAAK
jgi:hypothetical protein